MCPSSRCPIRRPRLYWLSWQLPAVDHYSVQRSRRVDALVFHPCEKRRRATAWISPGWSRDADTVCAALSAQGAATGAHWVRAVRPAGCGAMEESQVQISTLHYLWQNGLTKAKAWRCPGADEKERLLGFRPDLSRPALSTSADAWELESVRHRSPHGCARVFVLCIFQNHRHACQRFLAGIRRGHREPRSRHHQGPLEHPSVLPRSTLRLAWWAWRKVDGSPWKHRGEHIDILELRAVINGVLWRPRSAATIHSKVVQAMDSMVCVFRAAE